LAKNQDVADGGDGFPPDFGQVEMRHMTGLLQIIASDYETMRSLHEAGVRSTPPMAGHADGLVKVAPPGTIDDFMSFIGNTSFLCLASSEYTWKESAGGVALSQETVATIQEINAKFYLSLYLMEAAVTDPPEPETYDIVVLACLIAGKELTLSVIETLFALLDSGPQPETPFVVFPISFVSPVYKVEMFLGEIDARVMKQYRALVAARKASRFLFPVAYGAPAFIQERSFVPHNWSFFLLLADCVSVTEDINDGSRVADIEFHILDPCTREHGKKYSQPMLGLHTFLEALLSAKVKMVQKNTTEHGRYNLLPKAPLHVNSGVCCLWMAQHLIYHGHLPNPSEFDALALRQLFLRCLAEGSLAPWSSSVHWPPQPTSTSLVGVIDIV
jgi:hypothetical protein